MVHAISISPGSLREAEKIPGNLVPGSLSSGTKPGSAWSIPGAKRAVLGIPVSRHVKHVLCPPRLAP